MLECVRCPKRYRFIGSIDVQGSVSVLLGSKLRGGELYKYQEYGRVEEMSGVVSIVRGEEPDKMLREALHLLGGLKNIVSGHNALIKPNLGVWGTMSIPKFVNRCVTTKAEIVVALIKELKEIGIEEVSVAEGSILGMDASVQFEDSGIKEMVEAVGGRVIDLDRDDHIEVKVAENLTLEIGKSILNTDNLINVPVMKTHIQTRLTLGLKNLKGIVSKESKRMMHRGDLERSIALMCKAVRPKLTIVDGLMGIEGLGPGIWGKPRKPGLLIAGMDPVAVDAVTATIMGHDPREVEHIRIAWELGLGEMELDKIEVRGVPLKEAIYPFEPAQLGAHNIVKRLGIRGVRYFGWTPGAIGSECSGCLTVLTGVLWALRDDVGVLQKPLDIVVGPRDVPDEIGDNVLLCGNCQDRNRNRGVWLPGCPPSHRAAYTSIGKMTLSRIAYAWTLIKRIFKGNKVKPLPEWELYKQMTNPENLSTPSN